MPLAFSSGGSKKVLPIRSLESNVGIGLDPDGFSSSLDLMKTVGAFCSGEVPSGYPSGDPDEIYLQKGQKMLTEFRQQLQVQSHLEMLRILVQLGHTQRT